MSWKEAYKDYLGSEAWRQKRDEVKGRIRQKNNGRLVCEDCGCSDCGCPWNVHHLSYPKYPEEPFGSEPITSLLWLCERCHKSRHEKPVTLEELKRLIDELDE